MLLRPRPLVHALLTLVTVAACGPETGGSDTTSGTSSGESTAMSPTSAPTSEPTSAPTSAPSSTAGEDSDAGTTEAPPSAAECAQDSDCTLINSCCRCDAAPVDVPVPPCEENCLQPSCDAMGLRDVRVACRSGVCEFAEVDCGPGPIACEEAMPTCPAGTVNSVQDSCWGPCVHPRYCAETACPAEGCGAGWTCVAHQASDSRCVVVPLECAGTPGCACASAYMSEFCAGACTDDGMGALSCQDGA